MLVPPRIQNAISKDALLSATVNAAIHATTDLISDRPEFFPEYTDHGPSHNTAVLETALDLLTEDALELFSNADYAALALAVLLHDCGMHITGPMFVSLVSPENNLVSRLDRTTWNHLWREFLLEAKRFDGRKLVSLFGTSEPIAEPPGDPANYTLKDRLLIGEFLRRHHPRLAHEISIYGLPGLANDRIEVIPKNSGDLAEISGIIARSHGMTLRSACDIFAEFFHEREFQRVHLPVVAASLRIADFLQIQPERAPRSNLLIKKLHSPFSSGEWKVHQSVRNITPADKDPEAIFVDANPESIATYLKFKEWAQGFQAELDKTWAALGEVYGRFTAQGFDRFRLKLRRIRTSIDDEESFASRSKFLPRKIAFEASSADLLSLLVEPLYGDRPEVGLRELIQNSVDAVLEREHIEGRSSVRQIAGYDADVLVYIENGPNGTVNVVIEDSGIGMDAEVLQNYFLRAGASFRQSPRWKSTFMDSHGKVSVARTGRFGIGALAAFLLGPRIQVETRRLGSTSGLKFVASLDADAIEVEKCDRPVGTRISVSIEVDKRDSVSRLFDERSNLWDWYCKKHPRLLRLGGAGVELEAGFQFSEDDSWVAIDIPKYKEVFWSHKAVRRGKYDSDTNALYCNGMFVEELSELGNLDLILPDREIAPDVSIACPSLLVTDHDGHLPLNLQRYGLSQADEELSAALRTSMAMDLLVEAFALAPELSPFAGWDGSESRERLISATFSRRGIRYWREKRSPWCWEDDGWKLADVSLALRKPYILVVYDAINLSSVHTTELLTDVSVVWQSMNISSNNFLDLKDYFRDLIYDDFWGRGNLGVYGGGLDFRLVYSLSAHSKLQSGRLPKYLTGFFSACANCSDRFASITCGDAQHPLLDILQSTISGSSASPLSFAFCRGENSVSHGESHVLARLWHEYFRGQSIPVKYTDRLEKFPNFVREFGDRIRYYRKVLSEREID